MKLVFNSSPLIFLARLDYLKIFVTSATESHQDSLFCHLSFVICHLSFLILGNASSRVGSAEPTNLFRVAILFGTAHPTNHWLDNEKSC